jgi:hypothetical protein
MKFWEDFIPKEPDREMLIRTLARGTTIVGRMLDGIAGSSKLSTPSKTLAKWLTNAGTALWGLVEISVPRHWTTLLGNYWQSLLLLISLILILAGLLSDQHAVSTLGFVSLGLTSLVFIIKTILSDFMQAGKKRAVLLGLVFVVVAVCTVAGALNIYHWGSTEMKIVQGRVWKAINKCH